MDTISFWIIRKKNACDYTGLVPKQISGNISLNSGNKIELTAKEFQLLEYFIRNKKMEWDEYKAQVTQYEIDKYLPIL